MQHIQRCTLIQAGANFKDVMQQLLPAEQDSKVASPQKGDPTPQTQDSPQKEDGKQVQRTSSTAKASTPKRQDQVTTKSTGARSSDKGRQDRDRRQDFGRHQQVSGLAAVLCLHTLCRQHVSLN